MRHARLVLDSLVGCANGEGIGYLLGLEFKGAIEQIAQFVIHVGRKGVVLVQDCGMQLDRTRPACPGEGYEQNFAAC